MRILGLFIFFLSTVLQDLHAQKNDFTKYFEFTIQAREYFDKQDYQSALKVSEQAFALVEYPASRDLFKAVKIAVALNDSALIRNYSKRLASLYGVLPDLKIIQDSILYEKIQSENAEQIRSTTINFDQEYIRLLDSLSAEDQSLRKDGAFVYANGINTDSLRTMHLLFLINQRGFPSQRLAGMKGYNAAMLIFLHADFDLKNVFLGQLMLDNVMNGNMDPASYASIIDRRCNFSHQPYFYYEIPMGYEKLSDKEKEVVTQTRRIIGLRSVEESLVIEVLPNGDISVSTKY